MVGRWVCANGHSGTGSAEAPCPECGAALSPVAWPASLGAADGPEPFEETMAGFPPGPGPVAAPVESDQTILPPDKETWRPAGAGPAPVALPATVPIDPPPTQPLGPPAAEEDSPQTLLPGPTRSLTEHPAQDLATAPLGPGGKRRAASPSPETTTAPCYPASAPAGRAAAVPTVSGYEVLGVLGRGGMGVVYKARQLGLNRVVALKMVLAGSYATDEELVRFKIEAEAVAALQHPNIVQVFEIGQRDARPFFSMELCTGGSLQQKLQAGPMGPRDAAAMMEVLARAMDYAHRHGIVHRDLKPANILLSADGAPKVTDFGLAKRLADDHGQTGTEAVLGTPTYMAPEQAEGKARLVGPPADVYALGAIFYDMLTGEPPFRGDSVLDTLHLVKTAEPVPPLRRRPGLPIDLQTICLKCLEKDANKRYATAGELADDLRRWLDGMPIAARPTSTPERVWKWARRQPALAALVVLSFLAPVVIAALAVFYSVRLAGLNEDLRSSEEVLKDRNQKLVEGEAKLTLANQSLAEQNVKEAKARQEADQEKANAVAQEQEAQRSFRQALDGVQELLNLVRGDLRNQPGAEAVRRQLLARAVKMASYFTGRPGDSPDARLRAARAHRLMGELRERQGDTKEAVKHFDEAVGHYDGLLRLPRERWVADYEGERLDAVVRQWGVLETSDPSKAEAVLDEAIKRLGARTGDSGKVRLSRAVLLINRALHHQNRGQFARAASDYGRAEGLLQQLDDAPARLELARLRANRLALRLAETSGRAQELSPDDRRVLQLARADGEKAVAALQALRGERPGESAVTNELGRAWSNLGLVLDRLGERAEARRVYAAAIELFAELAGKSPRTVDYRFLLAQARGNLGLHLLAGKDYAGAEKALAPAREALEGLVKSFPDMVLYRLALVRLYNSEGVAQLAAGRFDQAEPPLERAADELRRAFRQLPAFQAPYREREAVFQNLILLHDRHSRAARQRSDWAQAERAQARLVELRRELLRAPAPRDIRTRADRAGQLAEQALLRAELAATLRVSADVLVRRGKHAEAARAFAELTDLTSDGWAGRVELAALLCRCIRLAEDDRLLSASGKARAARGYGEQALSCLRPLEGRPPAGLAERLRSAEFRPLAGLAALRADFRELQDRVDRAEQEAN